MNQDLTFEDAFKMENLMENLKERENRYIVDRITSKNPSGHKVYKEVTTLDQSSQDAPAIIGIREHVFTGASSLIKSMHSFYDFIALHALEHLQFIRKTCF